MPRKISARSASSTGWNTTAAERASPITASPRRNWSIEAAAIRPAATARTARSAPSTASPPANTPGRFVASVRSSAAMPQPVTRSPSSSASERSTAWPMAAITVEHSMT